MSPPEPRRIPPSLSRDAPARPPDPVEDPLAVPEPPAPPRRGAVARALRWALLGFGLALLAVPGVVLALRWLPPPTTAFMLQSAVQPVQYQWVPAARIPESLRRAVIAAEDQKFWTHWGFDLMAIAEALEHNEKSRSVRGASTITQQTAKNLFLWPSRSYLRKGMEASFTLLLELAWPKERILEVYLNVAEFGPGIYGAEAAARKFFGKPAERLSAWEAAQLAAVLPNPRKYHAGRPGPYVQSRTDWILDQIGEAPRYAAVPESEPIPSEEPMDRALEADPSAAAPAATAEPAAPDRGETSPIETTPRPDMPASEPAPAEPTMPGDPYPEPEPDPEPELEPGPEPSGEPQAPQAP